MGHDHHHAPIGFDRAFAVGIALNVIFVLLELGYGFAAQSLALIADAGHNASDVISLLLAWVAMVMARKMPTAKRTYGFRKVTILASLISAILLLVALGGIMWEAIGRFFTPRPVAGMTVIVVAGIGVIINGLTAALFASGRKSDLNIRGAFLHMLADAGISLGVVIAGLFMTRTGWFWLDPALSIVIALIVLVATWGLFTSSINLTIDAVPDGIDIPAIESYFLALPSVVAVHDLHVWALSTTTVALTAHLVTAPSSAACPDLPAVQEHLHEIFGIEHSTIQIEKQAPANACPLDQPTCR